MPERATLQKAAMSVLMLCLIGWPPIHMALASQCGFSSWKYFGWGMYATPYSPKNQIVHVYLLPATPLENPPPKPETLLHPAYLEMSYEVFRWHDGGFATLAAIPLARHQSRTVWRLKILRGAADAEVVAREIARDHKIPPARSRMVILLVHPRVDPLTRTTYSDVDTFLHENGSTKKLGTYRSEELADLLLSLMREQAAPSHVTISVRAPAA